MSFFRFFGVAAVPFGVGLAVVALVPFAGCGGNAFTAGAGTGGEGGGTVDGGSATGDAGPGFCASLDASQFPFCADFDEAALQQGWSSFSAPGQATLTTDSDASVSPPHSLLAFAPAQDLSDGGANAAVLTKTGLPKGPVHIAFDVRLDELKFPTNEDTAGSSIIPLLYTQGKDYDLFLAFTPSTTSSFSLVLVEVTTPAISIGDAGTTVTGHDVSKLLTSASLTSWLPVALDFDLDRDGGLGLTPIEAKVTLGTASMQVSLTPPLDATQGDRSLTLGIEAIGVTGEAKIHFDNVTYGAQ